MTEITFRDLANKMVDNATEYIADKMRNNVVLVVVYLHIVLYGLAGALFILRKFGLL